MKNLFYIIVVVLVTCFTAYSQEDELNLSNINLNTEQENFNILNNFGLYQVNPIKSVATESNNILIQQIGDLNRIYTQTQSQSSDIELIQFGDNNEIDLSINAPKISGKVLQNGNSNTILNSIYYTNLNVNLNTQQKGNNLTINKIGLNSLSNNLQINQQGNFKTITIISN